MSEVVYMFTAAYIDSDDKFSYFEQFIENIKQQSPTHPDIAFIGLSASHLNYITKAKELIQATNVGWIRLITFGKQITQLNVYHRLLKQCHNMGVKPNTWITFADADDIIHPERDVKFRATIKIIPENKAISAILHPYLVSNKSSTEYVNHSIVTEMIDKNVFYFEKLDYKTPCEHYLYCVRFEIIDEFFKMTNSYLRNIYTSDMHLSAFIRTYAHNGHETLVSLLSELELKNKRWFYFYRIHSENITSRCLIMNTNDYKNCLHGIANSLFIPNMTKELKDTYNKIDQPNVFLYNLVSYCKYPTRDISKQLRNRLFGNENGFDLFRTNKLPIVLKFLGLICKELSKLFPVYYKDMWLKLSTFFFNDIMFFKNSKNKLFKEIDFSIETNKRNTFFLKDLH